MSGIVDPALDMESNSQKIDSFNESSHVGETCRLRSELNVNCLLELFSFLDVEDLFQLCEVDTFFKELITKWTIKTKMIVVEFCTSHTKIDSLIDFEKSDNDAHLLKVFRTFGNSMTKFSILFDNFTVLLELIIRYCKPAATDRVGVVSIQWTYDCS